MSVECEGEECDRDSKVKTMTIDNGLQNIGDSEGAIVVLFVKNGSPLTPLMMTGVVDVENKLQRSQSFRIKSTDATLKVVPRSFNDTGPLERVLDMLAEGHVRHNKGLEFADEVRRSLFKVAFVDSVEALAYRSEGSKPHMFGISSHPSS